MKQVMFLCTLLYACAYDDDEPVDVVASEVACGAKLAAASVTASGAQTGNPATSAVDGDLATRWSQNEVGATLTVDLGALKSVCAASVAWYSGTTRTSAFTVSVSQTGASYEVVLARSSTGTTSGLEAYAFAARDARYVRLTVNGNSQSDWASVSEFEVGGGAARLTRAQRDALVYGNYKPSAATVGPVPEVTLKQHGDPSGTRNYVVTKNNEVVENLEIWGGVNLAGFKNVTVRNCIIHGTLERGRSTAHVFSTSNDLGGVTIIDSAFVGRPVTVPASYNGVPNPDAGTVNRANEWVSGISGANFTLLRTEIVNAPDGIGLISELGNVTVKGSWIHDGWFNEWTEAQGSPQSGTARYYPYMHGSPRYTHADGIQFHRGKNYNIIGNRIGGKRVVGEHNVTPSEKAQINSGDDFYNAGLMIKQEVDDTPENKLEHVLIDRNWLEGGEATVNLAFARNNRFDTVTLSNNRFARSTWGEQWNILRGKDASGKPIANVSNNVFEDDGKPVPITGG